MREVEQLHCCNVNADRKLGDLWEANFCRLLVPGTHVMRHQKDRNGSAVYGEVHLDGSVSWKPSPDITVWHGFGVESHHEIKHKNATKGGFFGLEEYRVASLLNFKRNAGQAVYYTIHDHDCSGGRTGEHNDIKHWVAQTIESLAKDYDKKYPCDTWRNGRKVKEMVFFWHRSRFDQLEDVLENIEMSAQRYGC